MDHRVGHQLADDQRRAVDQLVGAPLLQGPTREAARLATRIGLGERRICCARIGNEVMVVFGDSLADSPHGDRLAATGTGAAEETRMPSNHDAKKTSGATRDGTVHDGSGRGRRAAEAPPRGAGRHAGRQLPQAAAGLRRGPGRGAGHRLQRDRRAPAAHPLRADPGPAGRRPRGAAQRAAPARTRRGRLGQVRRRRQQPGDGPRPPDGRVRPRGRGGLRRRPDPADGPAARRPVAARRAAAGRPQRERARGPAVLDRRRDHPGHPRGRHRGQARAARRGSATRTGAGAT